MQTIYDTFKKTAEVFGDRHALKFKYHGTYIGITFSELKKRVDLLAQGLFALNISKGDKLAILSENRSEWIRADLACHKIGAIDVPIHTTLSPNLIKHILNDCQAKAIVVSNQEQFNKIMVVDKELQFLETIIYISVSNPELYTTSKKLLSLSEVMKLGERNNRPHEPVFIDDTASIIYTSGTTAAPKGVMLTHKNFMFNAEAAATIIPVNQNDVLLSFLPLSHILERTAGYYTPMVCRGASIAFAENISTLKENFKEIKPTYIISVPRIFEKIHSGIWEKMKNGNPLKYKLFIWSLKQKQNTLGYYIADTLVFKKVRKAFGGKLKMAISGGATLNHKLGRFFSKMGITIIEGYGLTETSPIVTVSRPQAIKFGTVGQQLPGVEIFIAPDKEILVRGAGVMKGYYNNPALTEQAIDNEGWFHTGDLGFLSSEGYLVIIGRKKEMIALSNGKIAWPEQLEMLLNSDRFISQSIVFGNGKSFLTALIVPDWQEINRILTEKNIITKEPDLLIDDPSIKSLFEDRIEAINKQLADWEKIRKFLLVANEFSQTKDELTPTLKLRRNTISEKHKTALENLYEQK